MRRPACLCIIVALMSGCAAHGPAPRSAADAALFAPASMRIHPIFSGLKDWTGDGKPDGIEALLEFEDQFNDPTKASGTVTFELFGYVPYNPDPRGPRLVNPWVGSLQTLADQQARWNRTSRTYSFQLEYPQIRDDRSYVLTATFDTGATRFFDQIVIEGRPKTRGAATKPATTAPASTLPAVAASATMPAGHVSTRP